ncbi:MAG TPA: hypothetical protein VGX91_09110 [Candidatus Cybelea sp.]|jgi:hypothetical protein|nr:hypothetical protein [Candidatus Cybelea sp.]
MASVRFEAFVAAAALALGAVAMTAATPAPDTALIVDSGSTNTLGYRIEVSADGAASISMQGRSTTASPGPAKAFTVSADTVKKFFADLAAARSGNVATVPCMKSASFGTTLHVTWQGWTSPDLSCPPKDQLGTALVADVDAIRNASGVGPAPLRQAPPP